MGTQARTALTLEWIIKFALILGALAAISLAGPVRAETTGCPVQVGEGVLCTGPQTINFEYLPLIQSSPAADAPRQCPYPVGDGVICRGPDIPEGQPPALSAAGDAAPAEQQALFIPLLGG